MSDTVPQDAGRRPAWDLSPRRLNLLAMALILLATVPLLTKIFTSDFGTHIAIGRQIVQTRGIPDKEFLNYPSLGIDQPNPVWLFQAVLYLVFAAGGEYGVSFLLWAIVSGILLLLHRATVVRGAHPLLAVAAIFAFSGFFRIRIQPRPEIFTYLFISLTIYILTEYYYGNRKRLLWLFPPLMLVWANAHASYLVAFVLSGVFFIDGIARAAWRRELGWARLRTWVFPPVAAGIAGLALCGLNPAGYETIMTPIVTVTRGATGGGGGTAVMMSISELTPLKGTGMYVYWKAAAVFAAVSLLLGIAGRRVYLLDLLLWSIAFKGAWDSARAVSMMGLFLSPGVSLQMTAFAAKLGEWFPRAGAPSAPAKPKGPAKAAPGKKGKDRGRREEAPPPPAGWRRPAVRTGIVALIVVAPLLFGGITLAFSFSQLEHGVGITQHKFSFKAAEFLRKNPVPGRMFNFFDIGGFLDWQLFPQALTFTDGRTYSQPVFMEHQTVTGALPGWESVVAKYGITHAVLKAMDSSGMVLPIVTVLANDPNWALVFADGLFVVFVKRMPGTEAYIRQHEVSKAVLPNHIIWEAYHYMYLGISPVIAYQTISNMYLLTGNRQAAIDVLRKAVAVTNEPFLRTRLMQIEGGNLSVPSGHP